MTVGRRLDLIAFAAKHNAWIIEDDYDGEFHYDERPVPALQGLDTTNRVFYIGTFSKTTFAALRTGYLVVPKHLVDACRIAQRHFGSFASVQVQHALADFISEGRLIAHVRRSRRMLRDRRDHLSMLLDQHANDHFKVEVPRGGMQLVAWCRDRSDDRKLAASLLKAGVVARPVSRMFTQGDTANGLLLGFGAWRESELEQGVRRLRRVVRSGAR